MSYITTNIAPSQGFHPTSTSIIHFSSSSLAQCSLHLYFKLPPLLFVDPYELAQRNGSYTFHHWGSRDLEKPIHALPETERGSDVLLDVKFSASSGSVIVELPMHLRYGIPALSMYDRVHVDMPIAFLLCKSTPPTLVDSASQLPSSLPPHVTASLPQNIFVPIPAKVDLSNTNVVTVPLGSISDLPLVELGTSLTIILCFFWLVLVSWNTSLRLERRHTKQE